jgi:hypothetical protein
MREGEGHGRYGIGDDLIGTTSEVLICSICVDADWAFDVGLLILSDQVTDGGIG